MNFLVDLINTAKSALFCGYVVWNSTNIVPVHTISILAGSNINLAKVIRSDNSVDLVEIKFKLSGVIGYMM